VDSASAVGVSFSESFFLIGMIVVADYNRSFLDRDDRITEEVNFFTSLMSGTTSSDLESDGNDSDDGFSGSPNEDSPTKKAPKNAKAPKAKASAKTTKTTSAAKSAAKPPKGTKSGVTEALTKKAVARDPSSLKLHLSPPKRIGLSKRDRVEQLHPLK
jgi:hypothetical protein